LINHSQLVPSPGASVRLCLF